MKREKKYRNSYCSCRKKK